MSGQPASLLLSVASYIWFEVLTAGIFCRGIQLLFADLFLQVVLYV
jgi:hypothetical protein